MNTKPIATAVCLLASLMLAACAAASPPSAPIFAAPRQANDRVAAPSNAPLEAGSAEQTSSAGNPSGALAQASTANRMVIQIASINLVVKDVDQQLPAAYKLATDLNGFVQGSTLTKVENGSIAQFTLKVPSESMEKALIALRAMGEVREEKISGQDVTAEFADLDVQVKNLESAETQLRAIMAKTEKQEDVLKVFNELTRVRGEIEKLKGRMNFLSRSADLATINVTMTPPALPTRPLGLAPVWSVSQEFSDAFSTLKYGVQNIARLAILLVIVVLPQLALVLVPMLIGIKILAWLWRRLFPKARAVARPPAPSTTL